jgi:hypothetical protein
MLDVNVAVPNISFVCKIDPIEGMLPSGFLKETDDVFMTSNTSLRVVILHRLKNNLYRLVLDKNHNLALQVPASAE